MRLSAPMSSPARVLQRLLPLAVLALSAISVPLMIFAPTGIARLRGLEDEKTKVNQEISRLGDQIRKLRAEVDRIKNDPAKVEQVARDELGLVRKTEIVFQFDQ